VGCDAEARRQIARLHVGSSDGAVFAGACLESLVNNGLEDEELVASDSDGRLEAPLPR
jgi:transposase-like protein